METPRSVPSCSEMVILHHNGISYFVLHVLQVQLWLCSVAKDEIKFLSVNIDTGRQL